MNYIVELSKDTNEHEVVNSCALHLWQEIFNYDTRFYGSRLHKDALVRLLPELRISSFSPLEILPRKDGNKLQWIKIYLREILTVFSILRKAKRENVANIIFLSLSSPTMFFVKKYMRINGLKTNIYFTLHGDIQWLIQDNLSKPELFFKSLIRKNLSAAETNEFFVVYGKTIKQKLLTIFPQLKDRLLHLEHPFITKEERSRGAFDIFTVGAFGAISRNKNSHEVINLANHMRRINTLIQFKLVGKFIDDLTYDSNTIKVIGSKAFLSRSEYEDEILKTGWLMYLYEDRNYELIASGAFLDAILYTKPIICIKNSFFQDLFSTYEIGIMANTIEDLPNVLTKLFERSDLYQFYTRCQANIKRYAEDNKLSKQITLLKKQLIRLKDE